MRFVGSALVALVCMWSLAVAGPKQAAKPADKATQEEITKLDTDV